jgi:hypothetical protein
LEILAEKFGAQAVSGNMFFFLDEAKEKKVQLLVDQIIKTLNENQYGPNSLQKVNLCLSKDFANSLLLQSKKIYDFLWKMQIAMQNNDEESECHSEDDSSLFFTASTSASSVSLGSSNSNSSLRTAQKNLTISNDTLLKIKRVKRLSLDSIDPLKYEAEREPLKKRDSDKEVTVVDYQDKEILLGQANLLWGFTYGKNQDEGSRFIVEASEICKKYIHELAPYKAKGSLGQITKEQIEVLLNHPKPKFSAIANDISRQMKLTSFYTPDEALKHDFKPINDSDDAYLIASIQHFESLIHCFTKHYSDNSTEFLDVNCKWNLVIEDVKLAIEDKLKDFSKEPPDLENNHVVQVLTTFLESIYPKTMDLDDSTFMQQLFMFFRTMDQSLCVNPFKSVSDALPSSLGVITQKENGRAYEYSFGDHCYSVKISQAAMIEKIYNCEINVVTILARNLSEHHHPWNIKTHVDIRKRKPAKEEKKKIIIDSEGISKIKNVLIPSLADAGFKALLSLELKNMIDNNSFSFSSLINKGKK